VVVFDLSLPDLFIRGLAFHSQPLRLWRFLFLPV
jgi:hypothetical protein